MTGLIKNIRKIAGIGSRRLILPILLSCVDAIFNMSMFGIMIASIINLVEGTFSKDLLIMYSLILLGLFIIRAIVSSINYTQTQYRGADITADLRISLGNHIRSLNLGYFNKNSIGRLNSTLTTDIADFENVLTHSLSNFFKVIFFSLLAICFAFSINATYALVIVVVILLSTTFNGHWRQNG
ncbi:ABC transporter transmembrane domain-containing protein [endosymbiont 'TC1' of Trimyema compressum]|uniref:ABC transporter transmembrane domain-containing protein n=1 Tax=endosymbiont 'TC1' of Trimyema compressum TaxID=243899 RepID=UPI001FDF3EB5|nr:ABC transporter transmembrane domain-containing protein [endosymbiont 'TC1' of Trimyema compressum]